MMPKFRAFHKEAERMYSVLLIDFVDATVNMGRNLELCIIPLEEVVLMQSTCLFDKNGVEIFEGDIVRSSLFSSYAGEVSRSKTGAYRINSREDYAASVALNSEHIEIIGNIYEHPNILET